MPEEDEYDDDDDNDQKDPTVVLKQQKYTTWFYVLLLMGKSRTSCSSLQCTFIDDFMTKFEDKRILSNISSYTKSLKVA